MGDRFTRNDRSVERLLSLTALLESTERPLTERQIVDRLGDFYGGGTEETARKRFQGDLRRLREVGEEIEVRPDAEGRANTYRIDGAARRLPPLELDRDEWVALAGALGAVRVAAQWERPAAGKLDVGAPAELGGQPPVRTGGLLAALPGDEVLPALFEAGRTHRAATFAYRGRKRVVDPWGLLFRDGFWYLVGFDRGAEASRVFRVDRIESDVSPGPATGFRPRPAGFDPAASMDRNRLLIGNGHVRTARVRLDPSARKRNDAAAGPGRVVAEGPDGGADIDVDFRSLAALRSWVLRFGARAEVLGPPEVRDDLRAWLAAVAERPPASPEPAWLEARAARRDPVAPRAGVAAERSGRGLQSVPVVERLSRVLVMVPWLVGRGRVPLAEVAERFGLAPDEVVTELMAAAASGVGPDPEHFIDLVVEEDEGWVEMGVPNYIDEPARFRPAEGFALLAAGRTVAGLPGADPSGALARALARLERVLGDPPPVAVDLRLPRLLGVVQAAADEGRQLRIEYYSAYRDTWTTRVVSPLRTYFTEGRWFLLAGDEAWPAGGTRRYRIDRVLDARPTGGQVAAGAVEPPLARPFEPGEGAERVVLRLAPEARWVVETYPVHVLEERAGGGCVVALAVTGEPWLDRLVLRVGLHGEVVAPAARCGAATGAARRLLERYR